MMTPPTDMGRDQLAREIHHAERIIGLSPVPSWGELSETGQQEYLQVADALMARTVVLARTHHGEATALDYTQGAIAQAMDQATQHAADALRRASEMGTAVYYDSSVTADERTLVQMIGQAYVTGHRAAASAACGALDDIARLQSEADDARKAMDTVRGIVADVKTKTADGRAVMVKLAETPPTIDDIGPQWADGTYPGGYYADSIDGTIVIRDLPDGTGRVYLTPEEACVLVPQLLALVRDHEQSEADKRAGQIARFAEKAHVDLCGGSADEAAACTQCQEFGAFVIDRWAAQQAADEAADAA